MEDVYLGDIMTRWQKTALTVGGIVCLISLLIFVVITLELLWAFVSRLLCKMGSKVTRYEIKTNVFNFNTLQSGLLTVAYGVGAYFFLCLIAG